MHIPDGFLDGKTAAATAVLSVAALVAATRQAKQKLHRRQVPMMGLAAAFVFTAQMINFPVAAGTSGHLMGSVLVSVLLGPGPAIIVMTAVLTVQALLFADGGLLSLGANVFNMAVLGTTGGAAVYALLSRMMKGERGMLVASGVGAWCSIVLASVACAGELAWSGTASWETVFPAMALVHMVIGFGEALITVLVLAAILVSRPELLAAPPGSGTGHAWFIYAGLATVGLVLFVSPFASPWPDGLEKVASALGFESRALAVPLAPHPLANYMVPGIGSPALATALAGVVGTVVVFVFSFVLARVVLSRSKS